MLGERRAASPRVVIVVLPEEIDMINAPQAEEELISAIGQDVTLIADMSATTFCDNAGARAVRLAWKRAAAAGGELRVVITTEPVRRVFSLLGIEQVIGTYPSLDDALAGSVPADGHGAPGSAARTGPAASCQWQRAEG